jgi:hypothetical protein
MLELDFLAPPTNVYAPECVECEFSEVEPSLYGLLRNSAPNVKRVW